VCTVLNLFAASPSGIQHASRPIASNRLAVISRVYQLSMLATQKNQHQKEPWLLFLLVESTLSGWPKDSAVSLLFLRSLQ
jgi:hypothetical protein